MRRHARTDVRDTAESSARQHHTLHEAIWLPEEGEPVTLVLPGGEHLPARTLRSSRQELTAAVVVPTRQLTDAQLAGLVLEYSSPGGQVRLSGSCSQQSGGREGLLLRVQGVHLIDVTQRRKFIRVSAECPVCLGSPKAREPLLTHTLDLSAGGMLLAPAGRSVDAGDEHSFQLMLAPGASPVRGRLEVVRIDGTGAAGTSFTEIGPADRWRLVRFAIDIQRAQHFRHPVLDDQGLESIVWDEG
jgi:hypothetical protein